MKRMAKKSFLNKGAATATAKIAETFQSASTENEGQAISRIPLACIQRNDKNTYALPKIDELAQLIKDHGQLEPAIVLQTGQDSYRLISGERRYQALKSINHPTIDAIVYTELSEIDEEIMLIAANAQREKTEVEKANEINRLYDLYSQKATEIPDFLKDKKTVANAVADTLDVSRSTVSRAVSVKALIPELQELISQGAVAVNSVNKFASYPEDLQKSVVEIIRSKESKNEKFTREDSDAIRKSFQKQLSQKESSIQHQQQEIDNLKKQLEAAKKKESVKKESGDKAPQEKAFREVAELQKIIDQKNQEIAALKEISPPPAVDIASIELESILTRLETSITTAFDSLGGIKPKIADNDAAKKTLQEKLNALAKLFNQLIDQ